MSIKNTAIIGTSETDIFTAVNTTQAVLSIIFCNTTNTSLTLTVHAYSSGSSMSTSNMILNKLDIPATDTFTWTADEKFILNTGDKISAVLASAADPGIAATVNYFVMVQ